MCDSAADLVAACQAQDHGAQRELYEKYQHRVFRLATRLVGVSDAADATQQVFLQLFRAIGQFRGQARFETWLYRLAVNECLQHIRRRGKVRTRELAYEPVDRSASSTNRMELRELLEAALGQLDPDLRAIFVLREVEELNYNQIAETLQIAEGTVGSRLNRARSHLRELLIELGWIP